MNSYRKIILECLERNLIHARWDGETLLVPNDKGADSVFTALRQVMSPGQMPAVLEVPSSELIH